MTMRTIFFMFLILAHNKVSKSELRPTISHQELSMKCDALKKENKELKKTAGNVCALQKRYEKLKHHFEIKDLNHRAERRTVALRDSEVKDLKEKIAKLSKQQTNNNEVEHSSDDEDDEDVEVIKYVNKRHIE